MVHEASTDDLNRMIDCIKGVSDEDLFGWLADPEAGNPSPSEEYLALTCLTMARDSAKAILKNRSDRTMSSEADRPRLL